MPGETRHREFLRMFFMKSRRECHTTEGKPVGIYKNTQISHLILKLEGIENVITIDSTPGKCLENLRETTINGYKITIVTSTEIFVVVWIIMSALSATQIRR